MSAQESLTFLFDAIALGFTFIATIDLSKEIIALYNQIFLAPHRLILPTSQRQNFSQLLDPSLLPTAVLEGTEQITKTQLKLMLLLAPAKVVDEVRLPTIQSTIKELLTGVDAYTLKLRNARKLTKVLGVFLSPPDLSFHSATSLFKQLLTKNSTKHCTLGNR